MAETKKLRRSYAPEFKKDTIALVKEQNYTIPNAAQAVGVSVVRRWVREATQDSNGDVLNTDERAELVRLRKEGFHIGRYRVRRHMKKLGLFVRRKVMPQKILPSPKRIPQPLPSAKAEAGIWYSNAPRRPTISRSVWMAKGNGWIMCLWNVCGAA